MSKIKKITCKGSKSWACGNFYHIVTITFKNGDTLSKNVYGCEDKEEAIYYACSLLGIEL